VPDTKAEGHLEALEELLAGADPRHTRGRHLRVVATWEAFSDTVADFRPHLVYYYGHGIGDLVTNRTVAHIDAAHAQGLAFWRSVLLDGTPPHVAVAQMRSNLINLGLGLGDARWMTPVLHCHYRTWKANPPTSRRRLEADPHWRLKLDRVQHFGQVFYLTSQMLQERRPRSLAYVWYGQPGQGIDLFHQRLNVELRDRISDAHFYQVRPEWPPTVNAPAQDFEAMLTEAFEVNRLDDIPGRIRTESRGVSGRQTLVYVRHLPVQSSKVINPSVLKDYLEWWDTYFVRLLEGQVFALLGVSFVVDKPNVFRRVLTERERINDLPLDRTVLRVLDELDRVTKKDLLDFLNTHNIPLPISRRDRVLDDILAQTAGHYEMTLEALKDIAARAWAPAEQASDDQQTTEDDDDYMSTS
jgi:hypothetical protein